MAYGSAHHNMNWFQVCVGVLCLLIHWKMFPVNNVLLLFYYKIRLKRILSSSSTRQTASSSEVVICLSWDPVVRRLSVQTGVLDGQLSRRRPPASSCWQEGELEGWRAGGLEGVLLRLQVSLSSGISEQH
jgi:hypothetical protein